MMCSSRNKSPRALGPLYYENRAAREVVLPSNRLDVILSVKAIEVHVDKQDVLGLMFLDYAERRGGDAPRHAQRGGEPLRESRLSRAEITFEAHDVAGLQLLREFLREGPGFLYRIDLIFT